MAPFHQEHPYLYKALMVVPYSLVMMTIEMVGNALHNLALVARGRAYAAENLEGKVAVVTGASAGIGKVTATVLAKLGAEVILACRDLTKANRVVDEIRAAIPESRHAQVYAMEVNLASFESIRNFAGKLKQKVSKIDLLINNAGVMMCPEWKTVDGFEMQFGTNHLGHFLLTQLVIDELRAAPTARVVNVSSLAHANGVIHFDNINLDNIYSPISAYEQSKLANILFTSELARRLSGSNVTAYTLHPGVVDSELGRHIPKFINKILLYFQIDAFHGAQTSLHCALQPELEKHSGKYFTNCSPAWFMLPHTRDDEAAEKLWNLSLELCKIKNRI